MTNFFVLSKKLFEEGLNYLDKNNFVDAEKKFEEILLYFPDRISALTNLLNIKIKLKKFSDARFLINKLLKIDPNNKEAIFSNILLLGESGNFKKSLEELNKFLLSKDLNDVFLSELHTYRGILYSMLGFFTDSINEHLKAANLNDHNHLAKWNLSLAYLLNGNLKKGFELYESRFLKNKSKLFNSVKSLREIKNKKILIVAEQGFGDIIQFGRYLNLVKRYAKEVNFLPPPELYNFFENLNIHLVKKFNYHDYDYVIPLLSLPYIFKTDLHSIPDSNYLVHIKKNELQSKKINIGLAWSGRDTYPYDFLRSLQLCQLEKIYCLDSSKFQFYCLQKDIRKSDEDDFRKSDIIYLGDKNFLEIAQAILEMDLVISSDTSILHLASSLQVKTFGLIPFKPDWRWLLNTNYSPWYPTLGLFRCVDKSNDWNLVINSVVKKLRLMFD